MEQKNTVPAAEKVVVLRSWRIPTRDCRRTLMVEECAESEKVALSIQTEEPLALRRCWLTKEQYCELEGLAWRLRWGEKDEDERTLRWAFRSETWHFTGLAWDLFLRDTETLGIVELSLQSGTDSVAVMLSREQYNALSECRYLIDWHSRPEEEPCEPQPEPEVIA